MDLTTLIVSLAGVAATVYGIVTYIKKFKNFEDEDNDNIPDSFEDAVKDVKHKIKRVKEESKDVVDAVKEVGKQIKDIPAAMKGETRKGRKKQK